MSAAQNFQKLTAFFAKLEEKIQVAVPPIVAESAVEYFKESFRTKSFNGVAWDKTKRPVRRGSLMVRSGALMASIRPASVTAEKIVISAGSSKVPYAKIQNEGGAISRAARSELFARNRHTKGKKKGLFKKGTTAGRGFTFSAYTYNMPARPFMGITQGLTEIIRDRIKRIM